MQLEQKLILPPQPVAPVWVKMQKPQMPTLPTQKLIAVPPLPGFLGVKRIPMPKIEIEDPTLKPQPIVLPSQPLPEFKKMPKLEPEAPIQIRVEELYPALRPEDLGGLRSSTSIFLGNIAGSSGRAFGEIGKLV